MLGSSGPTVVVGRDNTITCNAPFDNGGSRDEGTTTPVETIIFVREDRGGDVRGVDPTDTIPLFVSRAIHPGAPRCVNILLELLSTLLGRIPIFLLGYGVSPSTTRISCSKVRRCCERGPETWRGGNDTNV